MNKKTLLFFIPLLLCGCDNLIKPSDSTNASNSTSQELSKAKHSSRYLLRELSH